MDASTRVALAGVVVSFVIGLATWVLNRRAQAQQHDLGLIDQIQEERTHAQQSARDAAADLDGCRSKLLESYHQNDLLLDSIHAKDQLLAERARELAEKDRRIADLEQRTASE